MKRMKLALTSILLLVATSNGQAQDIKFDQGNWQSQDLSHQRVLVTVLANEERIDSVFTEDLDTGELLLNIEKYPLARYEYHPSSDQFPALWRRIDIRQEVRSDSSRVELSNGTFFYYPWKRVVDIPNGAYHEFFPNGNIHIEGTLDGYNPDGTLRKTGQWTEWDESGKVIWTKTYP